jgi:outer membrane protein assembly factor BamB
MKRKRWVILFSCLGLILVFCARRASNRKLWSVETSPMSRLVISTRGEVAVHNEGRVELIDHRGKSRVLSDYGRTVLPQASAGERGFVARRYDKLNSDTVFLNWEGTTQWSFPVAGVYTEVSPGGMICILGSDTNFHALNPDGTLRWSWSLVRHLAGRNHEWAMAVGEDDSVALRIDASDRVLLFEQDGALRWTTLPTVQEIFVPMARDREGGVIQGAHGWLRSLSPMGEVRWKIAFPPNIPPEDAARRMGPAQGAGVHGVAANKQGLIFCHSTDGLVYVFDAHGVYRWSYPGGTVGAGPHWIAFSNTGDAIFSSAEHNALKPVVGPMRGRKRFQSRSGETNRRLVCLSPEGELRWEISLAGQFNLFWPANKLEWEYLWETRGGRRLVIPTRALATGPDGLIYFMRSDISLRGAKLHAIRGDPPAE